MSDASPPAELAPAPAAISHARARPRLHVDLGALVENYQRLQSASGAPATGAAVKANGYGLGAVPVARALANAGCRDFFVANAEEGAQLRQERAIPFDARVFVLNGVLPGEEPLFAEHDLQPVLNSLEQLRLWSEARNQWRVETAAALHLDTGINRLGLSRLELETALADPDLLASANIRLIMSHLACAAAPEHPLNEEQRGNFTEAAQRLAPLLPEARLSLANSAGCLLGDAYAFDLTRPGIGLYGGAPFDDDVAPPEPPLRAVATLHAPILQIRTLEPGEAVGYGATFTAQRPLRLATIALGYADGFLRQTQCGGYGVLAGRRAPVVGRVSMDLITLDVSEAGDAARPGALVEMLGPSAKLDDQARAAGTIAYEVLTRLGPRCERTYSDAPASIAPAPVDAGAENTDAGSVA